MKDLRSRFEVAATTAMLLMAGTMAWTYSRSNTPSGDAREPDTAIEDWRKEANNGLWLGDRNAPVILTELMDFQCPYCARLVSTLDTLLAEYPKELAVVMHHYPLTGIHPEAVPAAIAMECAERQGRSREMYKALFGGSKTLGQVPWSTFGKSAGVADLPLFEKCHALPADSFPRIAYGIDLAKRTGARGTPTVWVNGVVTSRRDLVSLRGAVSRALKTGQ